MSNKTLRMATLLMITVLIALFAFSTSVYADGEVSTLEELQTALNNDSLTEVIVSSAITLPNGTVLDGNGKTLRVEKPYVKEDGKLEESPSAGNIFNIESSSEVVIKNMTIMGGQKSGSGAISSNGYLTLENVNVVRSHRGLDDYGGVSILKNCNFSLNVCKSAGAIWCGNGAKLILDGCSFTQNRSNGGSSSGGGAIGVSGGSTKLYANNTIFANNATEEIGGAINIYTGNVYLMNCTVTGNCTTNSAICGGGIGKNGGSFEAVNCIFVDNYASISDSPKTRCDIGIYSGSNSELYNCVYRYIQGNIPVISNCVIDTSNQTANEYTNTGIMLSNQSISIEFLHPVLTSSEANEYAKYIAIKKNGSAATGGIQTYFDYSDTSDVKMGFGNEDNITSLGGLTIPNSNNKVTTYFEGGTREDAIIGASNVTPEPITTWAELQTALSAGGNVKLTQDIIASSTDGELYIPENVTTTLDLNGYIINKNGFGGNVIRVYGGNLTIDDSNPNRIHTPEVSYNEPISNNSVIILGGIITGGNRGICLEHAGTITMNAGTIAGNYLNDKYSNGGAGAYVLSGSTFTMNGGSIENNTAPYGNAGGVYVYYGSIFNMVGGTVRNNVCAGEGGGFFLYDNQSSRAKLYLMGGTVTGNKSAGYGGAVNINTNGGELFVSGNPVVQGNYKDSEVSNIKGPGDRLVNIVGEITDGAYIGVSTASVPSLEQNAVITSNYNTYNAGKNPENYFFCDYGEEILTGFNAAGEATFIYPVTSWAELRTSFGHYGAIKLTSDIKASASDTRIELGWCETCLDLNGHVIDCSAMTANTNAFATTSRHSVLTIIDSNPTAIHSPALSYIDPITEEVVVINGGIITGRPDGVFTGTEINCQSGAVVMKGGTILGKSTPGGSAVYLTYESAHFYMDDGTICGNNSSTDGGGIFNLEGTIHLNGGRITGNVANGNGGGIYQYGNSKITVSGKPVVSGNLNGEEERSNIYLTNKAITISDELKEGASLGITTQTVPTYSSLVKFTTDFNTYNGGDNPNNYFVSDKGYEIITSESEAALKGEVSTWAELQNALNAGGTVLLTQDIAAENDSHTENLTVPSGVTAVLDLNGHIINRNAAWDVEHEYSKSRVMAVDGNLTIIDSNPTAIHTPEFTYVDPVTSNAVVVVGGIITGGYGDGCGGIWVSGSLTMQGGTIVKNYTGGTYCAAGGVRVGTGSFTMIGGSIVGNFGSENTYGTGGVIAENGTITLSGNPVIKDNLLGTEISNLRLCNENNITINGALTSGANIGIYALDRYVKLERIITSGYNTYNSGVLPSTYFKSDDNNYTVILKDSEAYLSKLYNITVTSDEHGTASANLEKGITGTEVTLTATPTDSTEYRFNKWQVISGDVTINDNKFEIGSSDVEVKAVFEKMPYTVQFETYGGGTIDDQIVLFDEKATQPTANPSREGYSFTGWYSDAQMSTVFDFNSKITKDTIIYAGYSKDIWTDITTDDSIATVNGVVILKKQDNSINRIIAVYEEKIGVTYTIPMTDDVITMINEAQTIVNNYVTDNGYINDGFENETKEIKMWDSRKYETLDPVYSDEHKAMIREHVASGSYGKSTTFTTIAVVTKVFPDIKVGEWYSEGIRYCKQHGIMSGYASGDFGLNDNIARGQIVLMFYRLAGTPSVDGLANPFIDVPEGKYFTDAVKWAVANNITTGKTATTFDPYGNVTRQELAVFMTRYAQNILKKNVSSTYDITGIADYNDLSSWARPQMQYIMEKGIITGDMALGYARILPRDSATRAMSATMFMRFCQTIMEMS